MRNFLVNINGTSYEVAVEEIDGKAAPAPAAAPKAAAAPAAPAPAAAPAAPAAPKPAAAFAGGTKVLCPMPGTIVAVNVQEGDTVKLGQPIFSLEAMKMESEIAAPVDGVVRGIVVRKGDAAEAGSLLCSIE